jgi:hypothetical protein
VSQLQRWEERGREGRSIMKGCVARPQEQDSVSSLEAMAMSRCGCEGVIGISLVYGKSGVDKTAHWKGGNGICIVIEVLCVFALSVMSEGSNSTWKNTA